jgi:glycosyltransferase A (GT-A) superfamily protein (DUF2064 family)
MNHEIVVGFVKEHEEICLNKGMSQALRKKGDCSFCQNVNRDLFLLITTMRGARKTSDVGLALSPTSRAEYYKPYSTAGFSLFQQRRGTETERVARIFDEAFLKGYEIVILVAPGAPNIPLEYLEHALGELREGKDIILGPMLNGKFYLIGIRRSEFDRLRDSHLLDDIDFDNRDTRDRTITRLQAACTNCSLLPEWYAVKSIEDLKKMHKDSTKGRGWKARWTTCMVDDMI